MFLAAYRMCFVLESPPPGYMSEDGDSQAVGMQTHFYEHCVSF